MLHMVLEGADQLDDRDALAVNRCTPGIAQEVIGKNLGYGQLYYALTRLLRPRTVLVIGSGYGFTPATIALALKHDGSRGRVLFVDPGYDGAREGPERAHGGTGTWSRPNAARDRFTCLGVQGLVRHFQERNDQFFPKYRSRGLAKPDLVVVDGAHDFENAHYDVSQALKIMKIPGFLLCHDVTNVFNSLGYMGVRDVVQGLIDSGRAETVTFPGQAGLSLVRVFGDGDQIPISRTPPAPVLVLGGAALLAAGWIGYRVARSLR